VMQIRRLGEAVSGGAPGGECLRARGEWGLSASTEDFLAVRDASPVPEGFQLCIRIAPCFVLIGSSWGAARVHTFRLCPPALTLADASPTWLVPPQVWHDLELLASSAAPRVVARLQGALGSVGGGRTAAGAVEEHVRGAVQQLQGLGSGLAQVVSDVIGDRCIEVRCACPTQLCALQAGPTAQGRTAVPVVIPGVLRGGGRL